MNIKVSFAPEDLIAKLKKANPVLTGRCFENCVIAVIGPGTELGLEYVLGFVTPPGYKREPHAWLRQSDIDGGHIFLDPTLQGSSPLWNLRRNDFVYEERFRLNRADLLGWFRATYPDREFDAMGLPLGPIRGPIIDASGNIK